GLFVVGVEPWVVLPPVPTGAVGQVGRVAFTGFGGGGCRRQGHGVVRVAFWPIGRGDGGPGGPVRGTVVPWLLVSGQVPRPAGRALGTASASSFGVSKSSCGVCRGLGMRARNRRAVGEECSGRVLGVRGARVCRRSCWPGW